MCADRSLLEDREQAQLLIDVARMYYLDNMSQAAIADAVNYSRPTVSRMLSEARRRRIVQIDIQHPLEQSLDLERKLMRRFGLGLALVAQEGPDPSVQPQTGRLTADLISDAGHAHTILALSNGTSVASVVDAMPRQRWPFSSVVQMIGSLGREDADLVDSPELCRRMARRLGGTYRPLPVPIVLGSVAIAAAMRHEEMVLTTLELAARSDMALVGVGAVSPHGHAGAILEPYISSETAREIQARGAVAHVCGHFYNSNGEHVKDTLCDRIISMQPERLAAIKLSIAVAWGPQKVVALHAVLRAGLVSALVTDKQTAQLVLTYRP